MAKGVTPSSRKLIRTCLDKSVNGNAQLEEWHGINDNVHSITSHALAHEDIVIVVFGNNLLHGSSSVRLELLHSLRVTLLGKGLVDLLDVG